MAKILVLAKSGFGKTTSYAGREKYGVKGLEPKTTFVVQCIGRGVPNPEFKLAPEPEIKYIAQYNRVQVDTIAGLDRFKKVAEFIESFKKFFPTCNIICCFYKATEDSWHYTFSGVSTQVKNNKPKYVHQELLAQLRNKLPSTTNLSLYPFTIKKRTTAIIVLGIIAVAVFFALCSAFLPENRG
jgi:hypothetical protein